MTADRPQKGVLDTNILIHWASLGEALLPMQPAVTAVSLAELSAAVHGGLTGEERARRMELLQRVESTFDPLPFDVAAARAYGRIASAVRALGRSPRSRALDQMIAAIAATRGLPLYTTNAGDFVGLEGIVQVVAVDRPTA